MKNPRDKIIIAVILLIFVYALFSVIVMASVGVKTSARGAVLMDSGSGRIIYEKNADEIMPMASTTKIMTALVAIECASTEDEISIPKEAVGIEGSSLYLTEGETLTLKDLLYALMLRSANDAAAAIACHVGGSIQGFSDLMNARAADMELTSTHFDNPHGLDSDGHYTTAKELAIITRHALQNPLFREIVSTRTITLTNKDGLARPIVNHNKLLRMYDGAIGVKTGFTKKCGRCLVGAAERDGVTLISVTLDAADDWNDHMRMFDLGFSLYERVCLAEAEDFSYSLPVIGSDKQAVSVTNRDSLYITLPKTRGEIKSEIKLKQFVSAPAKAGDIVGAVIFTEGEIL